MKTWRLFVPMLLWLGLTSLLLLATGASSAEVKATTRYVATDGADSGACDTIPGRCRTVQYAIDQADPGDEIRVATGTYSDINGYGGHPQVVYLTQTLTLRGGYSADFSTWDPDTQPTTLDAGGSGRVLYITGTITPTVEYLRLTGGDADGLGGDPFGNAGGGVYIHSAAAILNHNVIGGNIAPGAGFFDDGLGGGLYATQSAPILRGNLIVNNLADNGQGGGLYFDQSRPLLEANQIWKNQATGTFGAGGGLVLGACQGFTLTNNIIADNNAGYSGSEIYLQPISGVPSRGQFIHNTIARYQSLAGIEGVRVTGQGTVVTFTNSIIAGHETGINVSFGATATLTATLWHNTTDWGDVGAIFTGSINIWGDPAFLNPGDDYHLASFSPARNQGVDAGIAVDIDGEPRDDGQPDLGADEVGAQGLLMDKQASATDLYPGQTVTYTIAVTNGGTLAAAGVVLTDDLPTLQRPLAAPGCMIPDGGYGGRVVCALGDLSVGQGTQVVLRAQVTTTTPPNLPQTMRNIALAAGDQAQGSAYADTILHPPLNCQARVNGTLPDYTTVQEAVDAASASDEVWIAGDCWGAFERAGLFQQVYLDKSLTLRGGYSSDFAAWDPALYPTTLDAAGQGRVLYATGTIAVAVEHLHLTRGDATGLGGDPGGLGNAGGSLYAITATVTLANCQIADNVASATPFGLGFGGGAAVYTGTLNVANSAFVSNAAATDGMSSGYGGGLYAQGSTVRLENSVFRQNRASGGLLGTGGGTYTYRTDLQAEATLWLSNTVSALGLGFGGGLYAAGDAPFRLENCVLAGNAARDGLGGGGSALLVEGAQGQLLHPTITRNRGSVAVAAEFSATLAITNAVIVSHSVGIRAVEGSAVAVNGVLWHDNISDTVALTATIQVSQAHSGDPAFAADGYHLTGSSAALDRGVVSGLTVDVDGQPRPSGAGYDLGADEFMSGWRIYLPLILRATP